MGGDKRQKGQVTGDRGQGTALEVTALEVTALGTNKTTANWDEDEMKN
jgi:hypothetical protein